MTEATLKKANDLHETITECKEAIKYLSRQEAFLRCKFVERSKSPISNDIVCESWCNLPLNKEAQKVLIDYYSGVLEETQKEFDSL